eukprot:2649928-Rhodomonas_salina.1
MMSVTDIAHPASRQRKRSCYWSVTLLCHVHPSQRGCFHGWFRTRPCTIEDGTLCTVCKGTLCGTYCRGRYHLRSSLAHIRWYHWHPMPSDPYIADRMLIQRVGHSYRGWDAHLEGRIVLMQRVECSCASRGWDAHHTATVGLAGLEDREGSAEEASVIRSEEVSEHEMQRESGGFNASALCVFSSHECLDHQNPILSKRHVASA